MNYSPIFIIFNNILPAVMYLSLHLCDCCCFFSNDLYVTCALVYIHSHLSILMHLYFYWFCLSSPSCTSFSCSSLLHRRNVVFYSFFFFSPGLFLSCSCCFISLLTNAFLSASTLLLLRHVNVLLICLHLLNAEPFQVLIFDSHREQLGRERES